MKKGHCKHVGILSGKVKDITNDQRERFGCSARSIKQVNSKGRRKTKFSDVITRLEQNDVWSVASPFSTCFRGDSLEYYYLISVFREVVELKIDDSHGRLVRLLKNTEGEARDSIKHYIQQTPEAGYQKAKLLLERLGDPHQILPAYRKEMGGWPSLKNGDSGGYRSSYNFLIKCESIIPG